MGRTEEEVIGPIISALRNQAIIFLLLSLAAFTTAIVLSRRISMAINRLRDQAVALGQGVVFNPTVVTGSSEIIELADSFNEMAQALKTREATLRESEFHLARSQQLAHLGSWSWDIVDDRLYWADKTYRLFGLKPGEFVPHHEDFLSFVHPEDRDRVEKAVQAGLLHGLYNPEFRIIRRGGEETLRLQQRRNLLR